MKASIVTKFLGSVKKICQAGHTVVFDREGSFIVKEHWREQWRGQLAERGKTARRALDKFRPTRKCTIDSGPRPW